MNCGRWKRSGDGYLAFGGDRQARRPRQPGAQGDLCRADALAEDAGRAPSAAPAFQELLRGADRRSSRRSPVIAPSARTRPSSAASAASVARRSASSARRRAIDRDPHPAQFRHAQAGGLSQGCPPGRDGRPLRPAGARASSTPPVPIPASKPRSAARPRRSPARPTPGSACAPPASRSSSVRAAPAAPSPSPP